MQIGHNSEGWRGAKGKQHFDTTERIINEVRGGAVKPKQTRGRKFHWIFDAESMRLLLASSTSTRSRPDPPRQRGLSLPICLHAKLPFTPAAGLCPTRGSTRLSAWFRWWRYLLLSDTRAHKTFYHLPKRRFEQFPSGTGKTADKKK